MDGSSSSDAERTAALLQLQTVIEGQKASMKILGQCFERCVDTPGNELSHNQQECIWNCTQRLFDTEGFLLKRLQAAHSRG
mmetsp:Transcript_58351/g.155342  ORF Transcript_58351/g.155342 Transcript_58351/m.155342 type:complete len:81 (+) Transcript_58351:33-275(+)